MIALNFGRAGMLAAICLSLAACSSLGGSGPSTGKIEAAAGRLMDDGQVRIVDVDAAFAAGLRRRQGQGSFAELLGDVTATDIRVGRGDALSVSVFEAPPALLFGAVSRLGSSTAPTLASPGAPTSLPPIIVDQLGNIAVPFAGTIRAEGRTLAEIQAAIRIRLLGKANDPQVLVSESGNSSRTVTVIGETGMNMRAPLTPHGERLLDVLASAETLKQSVDKTTIQIAREGRVVAMPLRSVIADPKQNIHLQPDDVVTALYKSFSFTALGVVKQAAEIDFETSGITLSQALGRIGGLDDERADVRGVFIFRFEDPTAFGMADLTGTVTDRQGRIPVIYRLNMSQGESIFLAQQFLVKDKDVIYVSKAPLVDLQRFLGVVSQFVYAAININNGFN